MRKITSIIACCLAATMALSVPAFAATMNATGVTETADNSITIKKEIVFINQDGADVYEPNIAYNYTLEPAAPNETAATQAGRTTIKDVNGNFATVQAGPAAGASITSN